MSMFSDGIGLDPFGPPADKSSRGRSSPLERFIEEVQHDSQMPNVGRDFVHPGKNSQELLMRTILKDRREANAVVLLRAKFQEFEMTTAEDEEMLKDLLAALCSIGGISRKELLMCITQIVAPSLYGQKWQPNKKDGREREREEAR